MFCGRLSYRKVWKRLPHITAEEWLEQLDLGSTGVRFETCWCKSEDNTPAFSRAIQGHCSRPIDYGPRVLPKHHRNTAWKNVIYHSSSQQYLDKTLLNGLIARGIGRKVSRQACSFSVAHPQQSKAVLDRKSWQPLLVLYVQHKWHTDTGDEIDVVKTEDMGLPAECTTRAVGPDQMILYERPSEVAPRAPAI